MKILKSISTTSKRILKFRCESSKHCPVSDDKLFRDPPPKEDCPICMLPMPYTNGMCGVYKTYQHCCGKTMCEGCFMTSFEEIKQGNMKDCCSL